jgi:hypothetical protein
MIDKFIYKFFAAIDEGFAWVDNSVVTISIKWMKIDIMFETIWKTFTSKHKRGRKK